MRRLMIEVTEGEGVGLEGTRELTPPQVVRLASVPTPTGLLHLDAVFGAALKPKV
jgi:hypothetical protein